MAKDTFDKLLTSTPLNSTAGRVTGRGTHYDPKVEYAKHEHWDAPPPMKPVPRDPNCPNLTGRKFGRFTVVGLAKKPPGRPAAWVVRCVCGDYEHRTKRAVLNPENSEDCCRKCNDLRVKQKRYKSLGARPIEDFTTR